MTAQPNQNRPYRIGIDLGGTKISAVVLADNQQPIFYRRVPTPQSYSQLLHVIKTLVEACQSSVAEKSSEGIIPIGIGTPGSVSPLTGTMRNCNSTCLNEQFLQADLESLLGQSISLANDANCFALSEAIHGAGQNLASVFGIILGTGVGGGLVINQRLIIGTNAIGGEWGHNPMPVAAITLLSNPKPRQCYCGKFDCVETYLSGPGLSRSFADEYNQHFSAAQLAELYEQGDIAAAKMIDIYLRQLAMALATVINIVDPNAIIVGGGVGKLDILYAKLPSLIASYVFSDGLTTQILKPQLGDDSGVFGAADLCLS